MIEMYFASGAEFLSARLATPVLLFQHQYVIFWRNPVPPNLLLVCGYSIFSAFNVRVQSIPTFSGVSSPFFLTLFADM
jgi:hypothetical protein